MIKENIPVTESTLSADHLGRFLQEAYRLDRATTCKLFRTGINHLYFITTNNSKFVFRLYTVNWRTKLEILYILQLYNTRQDDDSYKKKLGRFFRGYESIKIKSNEEKRLIPIIEVAIWFFYLGVQCDRFDNWSNVFLSEDHLKRFISAIKKWIEYESNFIRQRL